MMRLVLLLVAFAAAAIPAWAQPSLLPGETLEGSFVQERHLKGFAAPLRSEGRFVLAAGKGLVWRGEKPIETAVAITPAGILQVVDAQQVRIPASRVPF